MFVCKRSDTGEFMPVGSCWTRRWTADLQQARTYKRACDVKNSAHSYTSRLPSGVTIEVVPVKLSLAD